MSCKWPQKPLGELLELVIDHRGKTPKKMGFSDFHSEGHPVLSAKHVKTDVLVNVEAIRFANEQMYQKWMKVDVQEGDVVLTSEAPIGEVYYLDGNVKYVLGQRVFGLRPKKEEIHPLYLTAWLTSLRGQEQLAARASGSTVLGIKQSELLKIEVDLPPYEIQEQIAKVRYDFTKKIAINTQTNQTLEQIAQAIFKSWFVDFEPVRAKMAVLETGGTAEQAELAAMSAISAKDEDALKQLQAEQPEVYAELVQTAALFPSAMEESELGEIPEGWEAKPLGEYLTIKRGGSPRPIKNFVVPEGYPWTKIADATANDSPYIFVTKEFIKEEGLKKTVYLKRGALILSNSATPGLPRFLELDACIHDGWLHFPEKKHFTDSYLYHLFLHIRRHLVSQGNGSVFTNLKTDILRNQVVLVPPKELVGVYEKYASKLLETVKRKSIENNQLVQIRDTLLPKLLSGEIELTQDHVTPNEASA
ncbi:MAG: restriction endonuclease subunit S [Candidatus Thiodiazotropha sp.]